MTNKEENLEWLPRRTEEYHVGGSVIGDV
jgi:hypothetical protein